jgi:hypothetical protein
MKVNKEVFGIGRDREKNGYKLLWYFYYIRSYLIYRYGYALN